MSQRSGKIKIKSLASGKPPSGVNKSRETGKNSSDKTRVTPSSGVSSNGPTQVGVKMNALRHRVKLMPGSGKKGGGRISLSNNSRKRIDDQLSPKNSLNGSRAKYMGVQKNSARKGSANPRPSIAVPGRLLAKPMPASGSLGSPGGMMPTRSTGNFNTSSLPRKKATISTKSQK